MNAPHPALRLIFGLLALVLIGSISLQLPGVATRDLTASEATFTAISALTVTGLSVITPHTDLTPLGHVILLILIQLGGVGYMVLAVTLFQIIGRPVSVADKLALKDSLGLLNLGGIVQLTRHVLRTVFAIEIIGAILLWLHWRTFMPEGRAAWYAVFHSVSAFCNAGFDLFTGHPEHQSGLPLTNTTLFFMGLLILLGGLGIPVLFDFVTWPERKKFSLHSRITVPVVLTLVFVGAVAFFLSERLAGGALAQEPVGRAFLMSAFQSVSARTAGFVGIPGFGAQGAASEVVIMALMFIGCAPASMGGGITTGTFATLILALWAYARGRETPVFKGRAIPGEMVRKAAAVLTVSILVISMSSWLIALTHKGRLDQIVFEVVSAFATCGLTLDFTSQLNTFGRLVIMFVMIWGRLGALTIIFALASRHRPRRVKYPEEKILIG